jgi:hypothetical protein
VGVSSAQIHLLLWWLQSTAPACWAPDVLVAVLLVLFASLKSHG